MPQYMLLLYDDPTTFRDASPEKMQAVVAEYAAWAGRMAAQGALRGGEKLSDEPGRIVKHAKGSMAVTDGPFGETKEIIGGYFMVECADYDAAVKLLDGSPHLAYGGTVEVRQIDPMPTDDA